MGTMRGVSGVVAAVIAFSVSVVVAIAVSYYVSSLPQQYTRLEIIGSYAYYSDRPSIEIMVKNSGSREVSLIEICLNDVSVENLIPEKVIQVNPDITSSPLPLQPGIRKKIEIHLTSNAWAGGQVVKVTLITNTGYKYHTMVTLP